MTEGAQWVLVPPYNEAIQRLMKIFTILEIFMVAESPLCSSRKLRKHSLPTTEPVFNFEHYFVWFGNHPKLKNGFS